MAGTIFAGPTFRERFAGPNEHGAELPSDLGGSVRRLIIEYVHLYFRHESGKQALQISFFVPGGDENDEGRMFLSSLVEAGAAHEEPVRSRNEHEETVHAGEEVGRDSMEFVQWW